MSTEQRKQDDDAAGYPGTGRMIRSKQAAKEQEKAEEEEKEQHEAELNDNATISSFVRKRPSHRSSSVQPSNTSPSYQVWNLSFNLNLGCISLCFLLYVSPCFRVHPTKPLSLNLFLKKILTQWLI